MHPYRDVAWPVAVYGLLAARVGGRGDRDSTAMVRKRAVRERALELVRLVQRFMDIKSSTINGYQNSHRLISQKLNLINHLLNLHGGSYFFDLE